MAIVGELGFDYLNNFIPAGDRGVVTETLYLTSNPFPIRVAIFDGSFGVSNEAELDEALASYVKENNRQRGALCGV